MSVSHRYQNFQRQPEPKADIPQTSDDDLEDIKLNSFEAGYQAGWEDAVKAQEEGQQKLSAEFVQNIEDMSFTFFEAHAKLSEGLKPILQKMVGTLFPQIAERALGLQILEHLTELVAAQGSTTIEIAVAPEISEAIEALLEEKANVPFVVAPEPALTGGQVYLRTGGAEREVNLDQVLEGINAAIDAYFHTIEEENVHG